MYGLSEVYELEQEAEKALLKNDLTKCINLHQQTLEKLGNVITKVQEENSSNTFQTLTSLNTLKEQIAFRVNQLKTLVSAKDKKKQLKRQQLQSNQLPLQKQQNELQSRTSASSSTEIELLDTLISRIRLSLLKNLNITPNLSPSKFKFIESQKINELEHELQLLNFKEKSTKLKTIKDVDELKYKNELLSNLNLIYYSELMANREFIKELTSDLNLVSSGPILKDNSARDSKSDSDESKEISNLKEIVEQQQLRIGGLERDKIMLENQIVKLKERWNGLVENARRRKEMEKKSSRSDE